MEQPFAKFKDSFSEMYEVVKTAEVIRNGTRYKIEILKDHAAPSKFKVRYYVERNWVLEPGSLEAGTEKQNVRLWVLAELAWVETEDADSALNQALVWASK